MAYVKLDGTPAGVPSAIINAASGRAVNTNRYVVSPQGPAVLPSTTAGAYVQSAATHLPGGAAGVQRGYAATHPGSQLHQPLLENAAPMGEQMPDVIEVPTQNRVVLVVAPFFVELTHNSAYSSWLTWTNDILPR